MKREQFSHPLVLASIMMAMAYLAVYNHWWHTFVWSFAASVAWQLTYYWERKTR